MNFRSFLKLYIFIILLIAGLLCLFFFYPSKTEIAKLPENVEESKPNKQADYLPVLSSIEAKSFCVYDLVDNKILFSKDEHSRLPIASITKLMSGLVFVSVMPDTTIVTIDSNDLAIEGDSGLIIGEKWKMKDLLDFSLITSSNDGIHAIASTLNYIQAVNNKDTVKLMNNMAKNLGLNDTIFINETGLDIDKTMGGAYSSAYDISILLEKILKYNASLVSSTNKQKESFISDSNIKHLAINTNLSINQIPNLISSKTGFTDLAGGNLAIIFDAGFMHPVSIVVLGSSVEGRFTDVVKLANITLQKLSE